MLVGAGRGALWSALVMAHAIVTGRVTRTLRASGMQATTALTATCHAYENRIAMLAIPHIGTATTRTMHKQPDGKMATALALVSMATSA